MTGNPDRVPARKEISLMGLMAVESPAALSNHSVFTTLEFLVC